MTDLFGTSGIEIKADEVSSREDTTSTITSVTPDAIDSSGISTIDWVRDSIAVPDYRISPMTSVTGSLVDCFEDHFKTMDEKLGKCEDILDKLIKSGQEEAKKARERFAAGAERAIATIEGHSPAGPIKGKGKKFEEIEDCADMGRAAVTRGAQEGAAWVIAEIRKRLEGGSILGTDGLRVALEDCESEWKLAGKTTERAAPRSRKPLSWTSWYPRGAAVTDSSETPGIETTSAETRLGWEGGMPRDETIDGGAWIGGDIDGDCRYGSIKDIKDKDDLFKRVYGAIWDDTKKTE